MVNAILSLIVFVVLNFCAAVSGAYFKPGDWYERLNKPAWRPPNWLFPPAWTLLYIMIAVSGWLVYRTAGLEGAGVTALIVYVVHLGFNAGWSAVFFGLKRPGWAFLEVVGLWLSIAATMVVFHPINPVAAYLLIPYLGWVSFAAVLNFSIWRRNPTGVPADPSGMDTPQTMR
jgi:tryptophan-rich sensory protein